MSNASTLAVLEWARGSDDEVTLMFWQKLCETVNEPVTASARRVDREIRKYGGNTLVNMFRDDPIPYVVVAGDVADTLHGWFGSGGYDTGDVESCERFVLEKMEVDAESVETLCEAVRSSAEDRALQAQLERRAASAAAYGVSRGVAQQAARLVATRAAREAGKRVAQKMAQQVVARIVSALNVAFVVWTAIDLAGPATRVTIPAVTYVAILRKVHAAATEGSSTPRVAPDDAEAA